MSMNPRNIKSKTVYWINGHRFENSAGKRDGRIKAEEYALDNFLSPSMVEKFDSRTECDYYEYLLEQLRLGNISNLQHHFTLRVQEEYINANGDTIPAITYEADFIYKDEVNNKRVVVDVKGSPYFLDERFITLKQVFDKAFLSKGLYIKVIMPNGKNEWKEWHIGEQKKSRKLIDKQREKNRELKEIVKRKEREERQEIKEKTMILRYRQWNIDGHGLTAKQKEKLKELERKYRV